MQCLVGLQDMKIPIGDPKNISQQYDDVILYFDEIPLIDERCYQYLLLYTSNERVRYAQKYKLREDRILSVIAFLMLRIGLIDLFGISAMPQLSKTEYGKPYLEEYPDIHFSFSHCSCGVACAFSNQSNSVGVDMQDIVKCDHKAARYFMCDSEYDILLKTRDTDRFFTKIWTLKESYGKYMETGICYNMRETNLEREISLNNLSVSSYDLPEFIVTAVASVPLKLKRVRIADIIKFCKNIN